MRISNNRLAASLALSLLLAQGTIAVAAPQPWSGDGDVPAFYSWSDALPSRPGVMLRTETAPNDVSLPGADHAERILYTSTDWRAPAQIVTVSGIIFFPQGEPPSGGWPVIAWAHGTTGIADVCAPSLQPRSDRDRAFLGTWLAKGYAIVASDYQGLGTPGIHPYLQFRAEGYSVLDSLRAALAHYSNLSRDKLVTVGQSQGSEAAIAAAYLAPGYAPELSLLGTVATGIVAHSANIGNARQVALPGTYQDATDYANSAYEALWFLGAAQTIDPDRIRPEDYLTADGMKMIAKAQRTCMRGLTAYARELRLPVERFYRQSPAALEKQVAAWTDFPDVRLHTPVFVGTGLADEAAAPAQQYNFAAAMCAAGSVVETQYYAGADHSGAVESSLADSPRFVDALMHGKPVTGNCSTLEPPPAGPAQ